MGLNTHALVLSGELLPGFEATNVWKAAAELFRIDQERFDSTVLARAPMTIKESDDVADLERRKAALTAIGALSVVASLVGGSYFVLIDNKPRGPLPRDFIQHCLREGIWTSAIKAAPVGSSDWRVFEPDDVPVPAPPAEITPEPDVQTGSNDDADTVAAKIARVADGIASRKDQAVTLPPGDAIHAGFWRRCAAYLIDNLILFIPLVILNLIPIIGILIFLAGRWAYFALMESSPSQATLGKRAMGIIATDSKGRRLSLGQASGRYFAGTISYITLYIGYALAGWTSRKQALHDLIADTCVTFDAVKPGMPLPTVRPAMPWYGWAANCLLLLVIPVAILAAIAIPAYQDYLTKSQVAVAMMEAETTKASVIRSILNDDTCGAAATSGATDNALVQSIQISGRAPACVVSLRFTANSNVPSGIRDETIEWQYSEADGWHCISAITPKYLPSSCRP